MQTFGCVPFGTIPKDGGCVRRGVKALSGGVWDAVLSYTSSRFFLSTRALKAVEGENVTAATIDFA